MSSKPPEPAPDGSRDRAMQFWDSVAPKYAALAIRDTESYAEKLRRTQARLTPDMEVLEIGCGTGTTALKLAPSVSRIRATDFSEAMIEIARARAREAGISNVLFERLDAQSPLADGPHFDAALAFNVLHLVPDLDLVLGRIAEALKPGGFLITSTFCLADGLGYLRPVAWAGHRLGLLPRLRFLSCDALADRMCAHGFELVETWRPGRAKSVFMIARKL